MFKTIGASAVTSILCTAIVLFLYSSFFSVSGSVPLPPKDNSFGKYETIINDFLELIRKGQIEAAYKETSPSFQKISTLESFKKLIDGYQSAKSIPSSPCIITEYTEPFSGSIGELPDTYSIVQAKCEATEINEIKGFTIEFIEDGEKSKVSFINAYKNPITHRKETQSK